MHKGQKPLKSLRDEVYDNSLSEAERTNLKDTYQTFFDSLSPEDSKELRKYLHA